MNTRTIIQKAVFVALTLTACAGLVVLLVAAIGRKNHEKCKGCTITIQGAGKNLFLDENDIRRLLDAATNGKIKDQSITSFNLRIIEQQLEANTWVQDANLYFDNKDLLHVTIKEDEPVARVFTTAEKSFYIDSTGQQLPLCPRLSARVPVFTNFPDKKFLSDKDSALLRDITKLASFILNNSFWMSQVQQVDITANRYFEISPTIGNHVVKVGTAEDLDKKFQRLLVFYQQVLSKTGFNRYTTLDVQYAGQVIASKAKISKIDSVQLKKNIEKLLQEEKRMRDDTLMLQPKSIVQDSASASQTVQTLNTSKSNSSNNLPGKTKTPNTKPKLIDNKLPQKPKAVMSDAHPGKTKEPEQLSRD